MTGPPTAISRTAVAVLAAVQFVVVVDETTVSILAPAVAAELGLGAEARHLLVTPFAAAFVLALPLTGFLLARRPPARLLAPAAVLFALTAIVGAAADSAWWLVYSRAAQGASAALVTSCVLASLHLVTRGRPGRAAAFSAFSLVSGAGAVAALVLAGPLATVSWRWCLVAVGVAAVVSALGWVLVDTAPARLPASGRTVYPVPVPVHDRGRTAGALATVAAANAALSVVVITASFSLQQGLGWTPTATGWGFLPLNIAAAAGAWAVGVFTARIGARPLLAVGTLALAGAVAVLAVAPGAVAGLPGSGPPVGLPIATVLAGLGIGLVFPLASEGSLASADATPLRRSALLGLAQQTGLGAGALAAATRSVAVTLAVAVVLAALALVHTGAAARRRSARTTTTPAVVTEPEATTR